MKDVTELHDAVGADQLVEIIRSQCEPDEPDDDVAADGEPDAPEAAAYFSNDAGRAQQFVDRHMKQLRYVSTFGHWLLWDGHHWRPDLDGGITRLAVLHSTNLLIEAAQIEKDLDRAITIKEALGLGRVKTMEAMLRIAKCDGRVVLSHHALDADPFLLGVRNGVVELKTGRFRAGRETDLVTKRAGTGYEEGAECPRWRAFLAEVLSGDAGLIRYVQKFVGYTLTGNVSEQCFPFLYGGGKNGKSVFTEILKSLLGEYGQRALPSLLQANPNGREPSDEIARLCGARLVLGSETEEGSRLAESRVKDLTGGDSMTGRCLYKEAFEFYPRLKLWMYGNHKPEIRGSDEGIWRRIRLIPFLVQIPKERRNKNLKTVLEQELPGILRWAIEGTQLWLAEGLEPPEVVAEASTEYRDEEDTLGDFLAAETEPNPDEKVDVGGMYSRYKDWAVRTGMRFTLSQRTLSKRLKERGLVRGKSNGQAWWHGVALK